MALNRIGKGCAQFTLLVGMSWPWHSAVGSPERASGGEGGGCTEELVFVGL